MDTSRRKFPKRFSRFRIPAQIVQYHSNERRKSLQTDQNRMHSGYGKFCFCDKRDIPFILRKQPILKAAVFMKDVPRFSLYKFIKLVIRSGVVFLQSDVNRAKVHLGEKQASYKIIPRSKS